MSTRRSELTRQAARLFAEKGYHGTSMATSPRDGRAEGLALPHVRSKADLLWDRTRRRSRVPCALDGIDERLPAIEKLRLALRAHLRVVSEQLDIATVFVREWRYLEGERRDEFIAERRRYEERIRTLFREGVEQSELRTDLDVSVAALVFLSAANWAYTWLQPGRDTDDLADRFFELLVDGMRGYATPAG